MIPNPSDAAPLNLDRLQLTDGNLSLSSMRCKHYYKLMNECSVTEPTGVKNWREKFPNVFVDWRVANIYTVTKDNNLSIQTFTQSNYHLLKRNSRNLTLQLTTSAPYVPMQTPYFSTFMECNVSSSMYSSILKWFDDIHSLNLNLTNEEIMFNLTGEVEQLTPIKKLRLDLL